jgi:type IV conjugative transfer system coupling protein TraD
MSFAGKNLTQGGQMTAYRWRMFLQVNNWIGFWIFILFIALASVIFFWGVPQDVLDNGSLYWYANINQSFIVLMPVDHSKFYDVHYYYAPANVTYTLKMTLTQIFTDPYMNAMGEQLASRLQRAAMASGIFSVCVFMALTWYISRIGQQESEDQYISGMQLTDKPEEVNRLLRKNGELSDLRVGDLHMVKRAEVMNFLIHGTIGVGKSTLIRWLLGYIRKRGDRAIIYDSGCTFTGTHYNPAKDFILNAHDVRCANWQMWGECVDAVDYDNMAASLIPVEGDSDPFWVSSSRTIFADLAIRMSADEDRSIEKFLKTLLSLSMKSLREYLVNTPSANLVEEKIEKTAISIRSVVTNYAKALRYLQGLDDGVKPPFTIREWMTSEKYDDSWLFISTQARHRKSVRPLISLWVSLATLMLQSMGENADRRVWFIYDEIPSLQRIPELPETLAEGRKFGGCFVLGAQNMAQLVHVYGRELAKSLFDLLNTRMYGRSPSAEMAKVVEEELGNQRKREIREQNSYGLDQVRDGVSLGKDKVNNPIVDYEQIMRLPNLHFYIRLPGEYPVVRLALKYQPQKKLHAGLIERNFRDVLSPELEKVIAENERSASAAGLMFPTGNEVMERDEAAPVVPDRPGAPVKPPPSPAASLKPERKSVPETQSRPDPQPKARPEPQPKTRTEPPCETATDDTSVVAEGPDATPVADTPADNVVPLNRQTAVTAQPVKAADVPASVPSRPQLTAGRWEPEMSSGTTTALDMLNKARNRSRPTGDAEDEESDGGEAPTLDMKVVTLADGALELKTAGTVASDEDAPGTVRASKSMAQEEENILRHREPEDEPGPHHHDGEHEL